MTVRSLRIADGLRLPLELATESVGILAKRRAGKSTTARRLAEQLYKAGQPVVIVDPKGDWWGLRFARDGISPGLAFIVLGGEHGDVPLEVGAGELVAKLVVTERVSVVLDLSKFRKHEVATFMTAFLETLYRLKAQEQYRTPLMLILDEADAIAPQKPMRGEERMLGAIEDLVRRGGQRGVGVVLITQRSAVLNKNVLTQTQILIVLRTIAPQDLAAMDAWVDVHGTVEQRKELMASLPSLPTGEGWVWAPGWPDAAGIFQRTAFLLPQTFDSSATPKAGEKRVQPKNAADVDLEAFRREMAATIARAKQEDPKELRKRIAELEREKRTAKPTPAAAVKQVEKRVEVPILPAKAARVLEAIAAKYAATAEKLAELGRLAAERNREILAAIARAPRAGAAVVHREPIPARAVPRAPTRPTREPQVAAESNGAIAPVTQRILDALAEIDALGNQEPPTELVAMLAGYTNLTSKGFSNAVSAARTNGLLAYPRSGTIALTHRGRAYASAVVTPQTPAEIQERIYALLGGASAKILRPLVASYPEAVDKTELASQAGYTNLTSKGFSNAVSRLRSLGFIDYPERGLVKANPILFLESV